MFKKRLHGALEVDRTGDNDGAFEALGFDPAVDGKKLAGQILDIA